MGGDRGTHLGQRTCAAQNRPDTRALSQTIRVFFPTHLATEGLSTHGPARGLLALGYAGWGPGQLDRELRENSWLSVKVEAEDIGLVFDDDHASKWQRALGRLGVDPVLLSGVGGRA